MTGRTTPVRRTSRGSSSGASVAARTCALLLVAGGCQMPDVLLGEVEASLNGPDAAGQEAGDEGRAAEGRGGNRGGEYDRGSGNDHSYPEYCKNSFLQCGLLFDWTVCPEGTQAQGACVRNRDGDCEWQCECVSFGYQPWYDACDWCRDDQYCYVKNCGRDGDRGVCRSLPESCGWDYNWEYNPVCGCNGFTFDNDCDAALADVPIDYDGRCIAIPCGT